MNNKLLVPALVVSVALCGLLVGGASARPPERTTWEYRVFRMDPTEYQEKADYLEILRRDGPLKTDGTFKEHVLRYLGAEGWELVQVTQPTRGMTYFYMKRPAR